MVSLRDTSQADKSIRHAERLGPVGREHVLILYIYMCLIIFYNFTFDIQIVLIQK